MVNYPNRGEALKLFDEYKVPGNIRIHCIAVSAVAKVFAEQLQQAGKEINVRLAEFGGLFHDFMKAIQIPPLIHDPYFKCFPTPEEVDKQAEMKKKFAGLHETEATYEILKDKWPKIAELVKNLHVHNPDGTQVFTTDEEKIVSYADLCCFIDEIWPYENRCREFLLRKQEEYKEKGQVQQVHNNIAHIKRAADELLHAAGLTAEKLQHLAKEQQREWVHG